MAKKNQKKNTAKSIMKMISDKDIAFVDFRFTDPRGKWQHTQLRLLVHWMKVY